MREQVKELWKLCFPDDSDEFVNLYFSSRYTDEINSAITENGRVVSALQRIPYPMQFMDTVIPWPIYQEHVLILSSVPGG